MKSARGGTRRERVRARRRALKMRGRPVRAAFLITILIAAAASVWIYLLRREQLTNASASCPVPATALASQALVSAATLEPVAPGSVEVGVLNATDRQGLADQVATSLKVYGFTLARPVGNDLLHSPGTMRCAGQIRFGPNGAQAARTLALMLPCAQLVDDQRPDSTVDLVLGSAFPATRFSSWASGVCR